MARQATDAEGFVLGRSRSLAWTVVATAAYIAAVVQWWVPAKVALGWPIRTLKTMTIDGFLTHWARVFCQALAAGILLLVIGLLGREALRLCRSGQLSSHERISQRFLTGFALVASLILGCGLVGLFYQGYIVGAIMVLFLVTLRRSANKERRSPCRYVAPEEPLTRPYRLLVALSLGIGFLFAIVPPVINDALEVTLAVPSHYAMVHKVVATFRYPFEVPNLVEMGLSLGWPVLSPEVLLIVSSSMLMLLLYGWAGRQWGSRAASIGLCGCLLSVQAVPAICHLKVDLTAAGFALMGYILWADGVRSGKRAGQVILAGIFLGWGFVSKMPAASIGFGILLWQVVSLINGPRKWPPLRAMCLYWGGFALGAAPLLAKGWLITGNPIFPFFLESFAWPRESVLARDAFGCSGVDLLWHQPVSILHAIGNLLVGQAVPAWLGLPLVLLSVSERSSGLRPAVIVSLGGIAASFMLAPCLRYMVAPAMLLCMAGGVVLSRLLALRDRRAALGHGLMLLSFLLGTIRMIALSDIDGTANTGRLAVALGIESEQAFTSRRLTTYLPASERAAGMRPRKILLLGEYRSAYFDRIAPTVGQCIIDYPVVLAIARDSGSPGRIAARFRQLGVSHVVLNAVGSEWRGAVMAKAFAWTYPQVQRYGEFWARWMEWMLPQDSYDYANGGFVFYTMRRHPLSRTPPIPFLPGTEGLVPALDRETRLNQKRRLEELVRVVPNVGHFESTLGCVLVELGDYRSAVAHLRHSMRCGFQDSGAYGCMGLALRELHFYPEAAKSFQRAAELRPDEPAFKRHCEECLKKDAE